MAARAVVTRETESRVLLLQAQMRDEEERKATSTCTREMERLEVQRREEEEARINRDLAYEGARTKWIVSVWNQEEKRKQTP